MDEAEFLALVKATDNGKRIIGFIYDNTGRTFFGLNPVDPGVQHYYEFFDLDTHYDKATKCIKIKEKDINGLVFTSYKPISTIQSVYVAEPGHSIYEYSKGYLN